MARQNFYMDFGTIRNSFESSAWFLLTPLEKVQIFDLGVQREKRKKMATLSFGDIKGRRDHENNELKTIGGDNLA